MSRWVPGPRGTVALAVSAAALVALAAGGGGSRPPPLGTGEEATRLLRLAGLAAAVIGGGALLLLRHHRNSPRNDPTLPSILATAGLMAALATVSLLMPPVVPSRAPTPAPTPAAPPEEANISPDAGGPPPPPSSTAPLTEGRGLGVNTPEPSWGVGGRGGGLSLPTGSGPVRRGSPILLGLLIAVAVWMALRSRRGGGETEEIELPELVPPTAPPAWSGPPAGGKGRTPAREGVEDEVVRAYQRLLDALGALGLGRRPHEAPYEHLRRAERAVPMDTAPMNRLAELYVRTLFGPVPPEPEERADSAAALERSLASLRSTPAREPVA
ncbi:MAG TPA: DUF4129 domain-containing protein [Longimicrobiales bacterium]|nr:DUF4129 domain-containing protein [Longimicrobiales bacterium]